MSNVIEQQQIPMVLNHVQECIQRYQKDMEAALKRFREDALFGIRLDERLTGQDYASIRDVVIQESSFRKLSDDAMIRLLRREIQAACYRRIPGPKRPRHLRHLRFHRWAKE